MILFYYYVVGNFGLDKQMFVVYQKLILLLKIFLNYVSINNNNIYCNLCYYDYCVKDEVFFVKLFMKFFMVYFNVFDYFFDFLVVLVVFCGVLFFIFVKGKVDDVRF